MLGGNGGTTISGTITYLYQDGRTGTSVRYTGQFSGGGQLTIVLASGQAMTGTYQSRHFTLGDCRRFLPTDTQPGACDFTYHGHIP
ncbi:MAG TPA: hypothetical protein VMU95_12510 [Trebonia sp.]|nr:hypothetical protein [Trebonia sp.]